MFDIVIVADDNAAKYVVAPHYLNTDRNFIFSGITWDASDYGFPSNNVTGILEVALIEQLLAALKTYAKGDRLLYLGDNTGGPSKNVRNFEKYFGLAFKAIYNNSFEELKDVYPVRRPKVLQPV